MGIVLPLLDRGAGGFTVAHKRSARDQCDGRGLPGGVPGLCRIGQHRERTDRSFRRFLDR